MIIFLKNYLQKKKNKRILISSYERQNVIYKMQIQPQKIILSVCSSGLVLKHPAPTYNKNT